MELKTHQIRKSHKTLDAIEALHINKPGEPSRVDHAPYEKYHDADMEGSCPICETLMHVKALRALLNGEEPA